MILDAVTFEQVAAVDRILKGVEGLELPGAIEVSSLFLQIETIEAGGSRGHARPPDGA